MIPSNLTNTSKQFYFWMDSITSAVTLSLESIQSALRRSLRMVKRESKKKRRTLCLH